MRLMHLSIFSFITGALLVSSTVVIAQPGTSHKDPFNPDFKRKIFHEYIDREQKTALKADGRADNMYKASDDEDINYFVTQSLTTRIDALQKKIELDSATDHRRKVIYLAGVENMLKSFNSKVKSGQYKASNWPHAIDVYETAMDLDIKGKSIEGLINKSSYDVGNMVLSSKAFDQNPGFEKGRFALLRKYANSYPDKIFPLLSIKENFEIPFRDSLIKVGAYKNPKLLYDYAAASNRLGLAIRKIDDPLIKTVSKMATSGGSGQLYFPFLDNILKGRQTIEEIDAVKNDDVKYYKLLVKTRIDYVNRMMDKEPVYEVEGLTRMLENKAKGVFIRTINALHEEQDPVRFRILQQLTAEELYYVAVSGENEIYTSSYTRGVFPIMMAKIANRGDSLLMSVGFDRFRKFIKMAAGYNTLNTFLKTFPGNDQAESLMNAFVNGLERSKGLEEGVDVADSYVSIMENNKPLANYVLNVTKLNYDKNVSTNNQRGMVMYNLLYKLFLSADSSNKVNLSQEFKIPPVYDVAYTSLANEKQQVIMQVFFYGDEDGRGNYARFMREFTNGNWKVESNNQFVTITSTKGKPLVIFANKPLNEDTNEDEKAQDAMCEFMNKNDLQPTIVVHRGHSYYAESTIEHILPSAKIVFMGSCGGYHLIHDVLEHSPDAHIIASKQIGKGVINQPFFNLLMEKLRNGNNIEWIPFWNEFRKTAGSVDGFDDYIPPHKNLGAIFIKAYGSQMSGPDEI